MNRATCGLQSSERPTSDNLTPQEIKNQDSPDMGRDQAVLSCPGSSAVAERGRDNAEPDLPVKSLADAQLKHTQDNESLSVSGNEK